MGSGARLSGGGNALRLLVRRAPPSPRAAKGAGGALRNALPRAVDRMVGLSVALGELEEARLARADLASALPGGAVVFRLAPDEAAPRRGDDAPAPDGLAWLGADLFAALVERRLTGALRPAAPPERPATPLDAVICGELIEALCAAPGVVEGLPLRLGGHLREPDLAVILPDIPFRVARLPLRFARFAERGGELGLALPEPPPPEERPAPTGPVSPELLRCRGDLDVTLPPVVLPWARVLRLEPGDVIELAGDALDAVSLRAIDGALVAGGRLGRLGEARAVRVRAPDPAPGGTPEGDAEEPAGMGSLVALDLPWSEED